MLGINMDFKFQSATSLIRCLQRDLCIKWLSLAGLLSPGQLVRKKQAIAELELWPVVVGMQNFMHLIYRRRVPWFVDNNPMKDMLVKGSTEGSNLFAMVSEALRVAGLCGAMLWISRVLSKSNIADYPVEEAV